MYIWCMQYQGAIYHDKSSYWRGAYVFALVQLKNMVSSMDTCIHTFLRKSEVVCDA